MRTLFLFVTLFLFLSCDDDDKLVAKSDLPSISIEFLDTHFSGVNTNRIEKDNDSYDVWLVNGFEVDFYLSGDWDSVDGNGQAVPQSVLGLLPSGIVLYVSQNYPTLTITEVNKESYGYEIGFSSDLDLKFNSNGAFIGLDL